MVDELQAAIEAEERIAETRVERPGPSQFPCADHQHYCEVGVGRALCVECGCPTPRQFASTPA